MAILAGLFGGVVSFLAQYLTKQVAITIAAIAALAFFTAGFVAAIEGVYSGLSASIPAWVTTGVSWFLPSNFSVCAGAVLSAEFMGWVYRWNVAIIQMKVAGS